MVLACGLAGCMDEPQPKRTVPVFVLDRFEGEESHGSYVAREVRRSNPWCPIVETDVFGRATGKENRYHRGLEVVLSYIDAHPADTVVVNLSLGSSSPNQVERRLIDRLLRRGAVVVAAAGNDNSDEPHYPAAYPGVVAVAAVDHNGKKKNYSNYGAYVDLAAEGFSGMKIVGIEEKRTGFTIERTTTYLIRGGTSFATPRVAGLLSRILGLRPDFTAEQAIELVKGTGRSVDAATFPDPEAAAALRWISPVAALCATDPEYKEAYERKEYLVLTGAICLSVLAVAFLLWGSYAVVRWRATRRRWLPFQRFEGYDPEESWRNDL